MNRRQFLIAALSGFGAARLLGAGFGGIAQALAAAGSAPQATQRGTKKAAAPPGKSATGGRCREGLEVARQHILANCTSLVDPNSAMHGVRALGRSCPLGPGDPFRMLLETCLQETYVGNRILLEMPVEREGHRNAMLKTLIEKGCEPQLDFHLQGRRHTFQEYIDSARALVVYPGSQPIDEHSWTIIALTQVTPPAQARWTNAYGQSVDLGLMIDETSAALDRDTRLVRTVDLSKPDPPRDCPARSRACGGLHMLYALAVALGQGYGDASLRRAFQEHMRTHMLRFVYDIAVADSIERENVKLAGAESARAITFDAKVKFWGHSLEVIGVVDRHDLYAFTPAERRQVDEGRQALCALLAGSRDMRFASFKDDHELYESLTGGVCHAFNGLMMSPA